MKPKLGDIVILTFREQQYFGVLHSRRAETSEGDERFTAYSASAERDRRGHNGDERAERYGFWYTEYRKLADGMADHVQLVPVPTRKTTPLCDIPIPCRVGKRVTLSQAGRMRYNVAPEHGGPYGEGVIRCVLFPDGLTKYSVMWDTRSEHIYDDDMLDVVVATPVSTQLLLWEETCPRR